VGNDCITPTNTYYIETIIDSNGGIVARRNVIVNGGSADIGGLPTPSLPSGTGGAGLGTVTTVGLSADPIFSVTGSPVTTSGTLGFALISQTQGNFLAAPSIGNAVPSFRTIVQRDIQTALGLTTKGDLLGFASINARIPVGADGTIPIADSTQTVGLGYYAGDFYNVRNPPYLAKGDNATDDTTAIQTAITAAQSAGGGIVYIPPGTYKVTSTLTVAAKGVYLVGAGPRATILNTNATTGDIIDLGNTGTPYSSGGISNLAITSSVTRTSGYCIGVAGIQEYFLDHLRLATTGGSGLGFGSGGALAAIGFVHDISIFTVGAFNGIDVLTGNDRYFSNIWIQGDNATVGSNGVRIVASTGDYFVSVIAVQNNRGFVLNSSAGPITYLTFVNCLADTNLNFGWLLTGANAITGIVMDSCWGASSGIGSTSNYGFEIAKCDGLTMIAPRALNNGGIGIHIGTVSNISITAPQVSGNSLGASGTVDGITIDAGASAVNVSGGYSQQALGFGNTQKFGINNSSTSDINVYDLDVTTNATGPVSSVAGQNIRFQHNPGFNPRNHGVAQPAVPASTVAQNNTTGSVCMVYVAGGTLSANVQIGGTAVGYTATNAAYFVPAGSSITLTYTVAPTWQWFGD
jgi:Pectate lyase superfamily protein